MGISQTEVSKKNILFFGRKNGLHFFPFLLSQFRINQNSTTVFVGDDFLTGSNFHLDLRRNGKIGSAGGTSFDGDDGQPIFNVFSYFFLDFWSLLGRSWSPGAG